MKNTTNLSEIYKGLEGLFNPYMAYEGIYIFPDYLLYQYSTKEKGINSAKEYLEKVFFSKMKKIIPDVSMTENPVIFFESDMNTNGYGRYLKISFPLLINTFIQELTGCSIKLSGNNEDVIAQLKEFSRKYRKDLAAILRGEINEERQAIYDDLLETYKTNEERRKKAKGLLYRPLHFEEFVNTKKQYLINLSFMAPDLAKLCEQEIDTNELAHHLELEKFYLAMMKNFIQISRINIKDYQHIHPSIIQVATYITIVKEIRKTGTYNLTIKYMQPNRQLTDYSIEDLIMEYEEIKQLDPSFEIVEVTEKLDFDSRDINRVNSYIKDMEEVLASKELQASWNFVRNGNKEDLDSHQESTSSIKKRLSSSTNKTNYRKTREELISNTYDRIAFLDSTNYIYKMKGKNNFDGYVGYIYENGTVIFEKFYRSLKSTEPASENATYVMSFNNFVEMSKRTKTEIMNFIRHGATDLRRIYHTSTWCDRILSIINGQTYNEEAMQRIEKLINQGDLIKRK